MARRSSPAPAPPARASHIALMRGINVGGKNKIAMSALAEVFVAVGCKDVRTYIQSGNVLFSATARVAASVPARVSAAIAERSGIKAPVVLRTEAEWRAAVANNPFVKVAADPKALYVGFLADLPKRDQLAALDPKRSPGDLYEVRGREVFLRLGAGAADTKLTTAYFDSVLGTISTFRNWRTVQTLCEMAAGGVEG